MQYIKTNKETLRHGYVRSLYLAKLDLRMESASDSSPKSVTTTHEQPTTLRAVPSLSTLARPTHSPSCLPSETFIRSTPCSAHSASMSLVYAGSLHACDRTHSFAICWSSALQHSCRPRRRPSWQSEFLRTFCSAVSTSMGGSAGAASSAAGVSVGSSVVG